MYGSGAPNRKRPRPQYFAGYTSASSRPFKKPRRNTSRRRSNYRIGGFLGIETKFYDTSLVASALTAPTDASGGEHDPSATICLNTVTEGNGESQRDGRSCVAKSLFIEGCIEVPAQVNQTILDTACNVMIAVVWDKFTNGAQLSSEDVFSNPSASAKTAAMPFRNLENSQRFQILKKKKIKLYHPETAYDGTNMEQSGYQMPFKFFIKLPNIKTNYSATTETIANIKDNSFHIIAYCTSVGLAPTITYQSRLRFVG